MNGAVFLLCLIAGSVYSFPEHVVEFEQALEKLEEPEEGGKHWALLVAGSNGYFNYRHQVNYFFTHFEVDIFKY